MRARVWSRWEREAGPGLDWAFGLIQPGTEGGGRAEAETLQRKLRAMSSTGFSHCLQHHSLDFLYPHIPISNRTLGACTPNIWIVMKLFYTCIMLVILCIS